VKTVLDLNIQTDKLLSVLHLDPETMENYARAKIK